MNQIDKGMVCYRFQEEITVKKRIMALSIILALSVSLLTACGSDDTSAVSSSAETEASESEDSGVPQEAYDDVVAYLTDSAVNAEDVVYTVNGQDITASEYFYWIAYEAYYYSYSYYYTYYSYPDLTAELEDGTTMADYVLEDAYYYATMNAAVYSKALEAGVTLSDEYQESYDSYIPDSITSLGEDLWDEAVAAGTVSEDDYDEEEKAAWIEEQGTAQMNLSLLYYGTTREGLEEMYLRNYYYQQYENVLFGEGGEYEITEADIEEYIEEQEVRACRYLLFGDTSGFEDLTDEEKAEYLDQAEACYEELTALSGEELDEAITAYAADNPDGNTTGELVYDSSDTVLEDFDTLLESLDEGEIGITGETEDGYYVIIRDTVTAESEFSDSYTVAEQCIDDAYQELISQWMSEAVIEDTGVLDDFSVTDFMVNLYALRDLIDGVDSDD